MAAGHRFVEGVCLLCGAREGDPFAAMRPCAEDPDNRPAGPPPAPTAPAGSFVHQRCHFCGGHIENRTAVSYRGNGTIDDIACGVCRTPVCDACGPHWWLGDGDTSHHHRLCLDCLARHPDLEGRFRRAAETNAFWLDHLPREPRFCPQCDQPRETAAMGKCPTCAELVCTSCQTTILDRPFCRKCHADQERRSRVCAGCGQRVYPIQFGGRDPTRACLACQKVFCHTCLPAVGKVGERIDRVCRACATTHALPPDPRPDPEPAQEQADDSLLGRARAWWESWRNPDPNDR
ncbi:MAG: hypothetical protein GX442_19540 [Candidatus Riflebacteria bacterium]|nr:hypothetical protein [Candidatus Riflebacteria bacterium]